MNIHEDHAKQFGRVEMAFEITEHEEKEENDTGDFDGCAFGHAICKIENEVRDIAGDSEDDENIHLPESGACTTGSVGQLTRGRFVQEILDIRPQYIIKYREVQVGVKLSYLVGVYGRYR